MNHLPEATEDLLLECKELILSVTKENEALRQENLHLQTEITRLSALQPAVNASAHRSESPRDTEYVMVWYQEWLAIQDSFSWKVTKPLRLMKKVLVSLRTAGLRGTIKKIREKLRSRNGREKER